MPPGVVFCPEIGIKLLQVQNRLRRSQLPPLTPGKNTPGSALS